ncbi:hypothetical protein EJB05_08923, partial [Eragrostis curvula]
MRVATNNALVYLYDTIPQPPVSPRLRRRRACPVRRRLPHRPPPRPLRLYEVLKNVVSCLPAKDAAAALARPLALRAPRPSPSSTSTSSLIASTTGAWRPNESPVVSPSTIVSSVQTLAFHVRFEVRSEVKTVPCFLKFFLNVETLHISSDITHNPTGKVSPKFWQEVGHTELRALLACKLSIEVN